MGFNEVDEAALSTSHLANLYQRSNNRLIIGLADLRSPDEQSAPFILVRFSLPKYNADATSFELGQEVSGVCSWRLFDTVPLYGKDPIC